MLTFIFKICFIISFIFFQPPLFAKVKNWDVSCHQESLRFQKWFPDRPFAGVCYQAINQKIGFRHLHGLMGELFFANGLDRKIRAAKLLLSYQCENQLACKQFKTLILNKATVFNKYLKSLPLEHHILLKKIQRFSITSLSTKRDLKLEAGICLNQKNTGRWLEALFEMYCPRVEYKNCVMDKSSCIVNKVFKSELSFLSEQVYMSSYYLESVGWKGVKDCSHPWGVKITCNGVETRSFGFECSRIGTGRINCK